MISIVPSVEHPSIIICSISPDCCETLSRQFLMVDLLLKHTVIMDIFNVIV